MMEKKTADIATYVSLAVIVISLAFIGTELTGHEVATDTGYVNITIESSASINFTTSEINFGSGLVNGTYAYLQTNGSGTMQNWNGSEGVVSTGFNITNLGNTNLTLNISSDKNASAFLGGTDPWFYIMVDNRTTVAGASCKSAAFAADVAVPVWGNITTSELVICDVFGYESQQDSVVVYLGVPNDATPGAQVATITATGTSVA
mgnify:CR=1 FL=1